MTGEMMTGRPGNLTAEQEAKLREMWIASLRVFGVLDEHDGKEANGTDSAAASIEAPAPEKAKKKKMSIFRRHKDSDTDSAASHEADADDKFGQTKQYHETLAQMSPQEIRNAFWSMVKHDNPDALLLRFLRARKWDVDKALIMMIATMSWRATEMHVDDDVMKRGEEGALLDSRSSNPAAKSLGHDFLEQMKMGKSFLHGTDKLGRPMCVVRARLHKQGEQSEESLERYTVFLIETARMVLAPPVDTACIVFDLTGFSLANMDYSPVKFMIKCFEANYPESLGVVLVHKAPWVFQGIWKIIRGWLDPVVASKVHFTNNVDEMSEFVARKQIPRELGGDEDWSYEYVLPKAGENDVMKDTATRDKLLAGREETVQAYEQATLDWIHLDNGNDATAVKERRNQVAASLRDGYWQLDPYLRAKSLYDRIGMIQPGGKVNFYPTAAPPSAAVNHAATSADDVD